MTPEDQERLQELKERVNDGEELDEDERDELKDLRSMAREEKQAAKALAKFNKAHTVFRVNTPDDPDSPCFYVLDIATAQKWAGDERSIEKVDRKTLTGKFAYTLIMGLTSDNSFHADAVFIPTDEAQP